MKKISKRTETIERQLVDKMNGILLLYNQPKIEWHSLHQAVGETAENARRLGSSGSAIPLSDRSKWELEEIEDTLVQLREAGYGACESCGKEIDLHRLEAHPTTHRCSACAAAEETDSNI